jgi:hypothetical protein
MMPVDIFSQGGQGRSVYYRSMVICLLVELQVRMLHGVKVERILDIHHQNLHIRYTENIMTLAKLDQAEVIMRTHPRSKDP